MRTLRENACNAAPALAAMALFYPASMEGCRAGVVTLLALVCC